MRVGIALAAWCAALLLAACGGDGGNAPPVARQARSAQGGVALGDTAQVYSIAGYRGNYVIANNGGTVTVTSRINAADVVTMQDPKLIKFVDKWTSFDIAGGAGQVYRLYQAAFNRKPDHEGLGFWINASQTGFSLTEIAGYFIGSNEFRTAYGDDASPSVFVDAMYQNVLHRAGEPGGYDWWVRQVSNGVDRRAVLIGFADGEENRAALLPDMANGFDYIPYKQGGPLLPRASSYENKQVAAVAGPQAYPDGAGDAMALADFFGDGTLSMVTHTLEYDPSQIATKEKFGHIRFYRKLNGSWSDSTAALLDETVGCLHPRKAIVADFNGDARPDVFFACHGFDAPPFVGEKQVVLLSQPDGRFKNTRTAYDCFCHGASAAEMTATRGFADVLVADQTVEGQPYFLLNNRDGTFTRDTARLPASLKHKQIWTAELVDFRKSGKYDVFLAGADPQGDGYQIVPTIFMNDGNNGYLASAQLEIPLAQSAVGSRYGMVLDVEFTDESIYLLRTFSHGANVNYAMSLQKTSRKTLAGSEIYSHAGLYPNTYSSWFAWLYQADGRLFTLDERYGFQLKP